MRAVRLHTSHTGHKKAVHVAPRERSKMHPATKINHRTLSTDERKALAASKRKPQPHVSSHKAHREEKEDSCVPSTRPKRRKRKGKKSDGPDDLRVLSEAASRATLQQQRRSARSSARAPRIHAPRRSAVSCSATAQCRRISLSHISATALPHSTATQRRRSVATQRRHTAPPQSATALRATYFRRTAPPTQRQHCAATNPPAVSSRPALPRPAPPCPALPRPSPTTAG